MSTDGYGASGAGIGKQPFADILSPHRCAGSSHARPNRLNRPTGPTAVVLLSVAPHTRQRWRARGPPLRELPPDTDKHGPTRTDTDMRYWNPRTVVVGEGLLTGGLGRRWRARKPPLRELPPPTDEYG